MRNYWQKHADIPSLYNRRLQDIAVFMYKINHKFLPQRLCNLFQLDSGSYHLRKQEFVHPRFSSVTYGKHSLRYLEPKLWNDLTTKIRNLPSLKQFKSVIRNQDLTALAANVSDWSFSGVFLQLMYNFFKYFHLIYL